MITYLVLIEAEVSCNGCLTLTKQEAHQCYVLSISAADIDHDIQGYAVAQLDVNDASQCSSHVLT